MSPYLLTEEPKYEEITPTPEEPQEASKQLFTLSVLNSFFFFSFFFLSWERNKI